MKKENETHIHFSSIAGAALIIAGMYFGFQYGDFGGGNFLMILFGVILLL